MSGPVLVKQIPAARPLGRTIHPKSGNTRHPTPMRYAGAFMKAATIGLLGIVQK